MLDGDCVLKVSGREARFEGTIYVTDFLSSQEEFGVILDISHVSLSQINYPKHLGRVTQERKIPRY